MATKISTEELSGLVINRVTSEEVYQNMVESGQVNEDELYFVEGEIDSLPSQAGNSGKFLTTDGTEASWANIEAKSDVFVAEYGVTTYEEVYDAFIAGKVIVCKRLYQYDYFYYYQLYEYYDYYKIFYFSGILDNASYKIGLNNNSEWYVGDSTILALSSHRSSLSSIGTGTNLYYGHVKLSDSTSDTSNTSDGTAATPKAVKAAYDLANSKDSLPSQSGNNGKFLTTNGSSTSWATVDALPSQTGNNGKFLTTNGSAASWATVDALPSQTGNSGKVLSTNGTSASWVDAPKEIFLAEYNVTTYANVLAAYNEGKTVFCKFHDANAPYIYLPLVYYNSSNNSFLFSAADNSGTFFIFLALNGGWDAPASISYASTYHAHGNISNGGNIGSTADYAVYTTTNGAVTAGSLTTSDPTASGTSTTFIKTASQDSKGKMTLTKASLPTASTSVAGITTVGASGGAAAYSHGHGYLNNDGEIGTVSDQAVYTTTGGAITAGSLATSDPTASGTSTSFIATASQDSKGKMTLTKASLPTASSSVAGITTVGAAGGAAAANDLTSHTSNTSNPHGVTASQVGAAPTSHATNATTYGAASSSNYGHVRLSDSTSSTSSTSGGYAATPAAVKAVNDRLTYGTTDLTAGTSSLATGVFYAYYT